LESDSPAALLQPGETLEHLHDVYHFLGDAESLSAVTRPLFGHSIKALEEMMYICPTN
jgi:hypothetical protein